ncbi:MAG: sugar phosphate isomerase/epimerase [Planctomycetota bacterium]|nr:sugar phosphate isomerase/epimerase [Planctomycetaceae bacterium]MDQ3330403.1 sugar phosphate isomerase/epimerase [Planctomycetota bacterium]
MKFGLCQELFGERSWDDQCRTMADLGYHGVEIAPFTLAPLVTGISQERRRALRETTQRHGLEVIGLHWLLAKTEGFHLTTRDRDVRRATSAYFVALAHCCADLGGKILVLGSPQQRNLEPGTTMSEALDHAEEVLCGALPTCEERGVTIAFEPLTKKETDFINTCAEACALIDRIDHPHLRLHQDVKAMLGAESEDLPTLITKYAEKTVHFHANDTNLLGPGMGETDFAPIFEALLKSGYDGYVSVEVFDDSPGADHIAQVSIATMTSALDAARRRRSTSR